MKLRLLFIVVIFVPLILYGLVACSTGPEQKASERPLEESKAKTKETRYAANELGAQEVAEIKFKKGSHSIPASELKKIRRAIRKARAHGTLEEIRIAAWADDEYPSQYTKELPGDQQELATQRAEAIRAEVSSKEVESVRTFNMAERPGKLAEFFGGKEYTLKSTFEKSGIPNTHTGVKIPSYAGQAIVMVLVGPEDK